MERSTFSWQTLPQRGLPTFCRLNIPPFSPGFAIKVAHLRTMIPTWETASCVSKTPAIHTNLAADVRQVVDFPQVRKPHFGWAHDHILLPILMCKAFKLYICHIFQCGKQTSKSYLFQRSFWRKKTVPRGLCGEVRSVRNKWKTSKKNGHWRQKVSREACRRRR